MLLMLLILLDDRRTITQAQEEELTISDLAGYDDGVIRILKHHGKFSSVCMKFNFFICT